MSRRTVYNSNMREAKIKRLARIALPLALLFFITAAPGGGGHGGGGGGVHVPVMGGRRGGSGKSDPVGVLIGLSIAAAVIIASLVADAKRPPMRTVHVGLVVEEGDALVAALDALLRDADFGTPAARQKVLQGLAAAVQHAPVRDSFVQSLEGGKGSAGDAAAAFNTELMSRLGLGTAPGIQNRGPADGTACYLSVVVTGAGLPQLAPGGTAVETLRTLAAAGAPFGLYFHYAPDPGKSLTPGQARAMLETARNARAVIPASA